MIWPCPAPEAIGRLLFPRTFALQRFLLLSLPQDLPALVLCHLLLILQGLVPSKKQLPDQQQLVDCLSWFPLDTSVILAHMLSFPTLQVFVTNTCVRGVPRTYSPQRGCAATFPSAFPHLFDHLLHMRPQALKVTRAIAPKNGPRVLTNLGLALAKWCQETVELRNFLG